MKRITLLVALLALGLLGPSLTANAGPTDAGGAVLTNTLDQAEAAAQPQDPNVTCDVKAGGRDLVQHESVVVGELYGQDMGIAQGECVSLDSNRLYETRLVLHMQYFVASGATGGTWFNTGCSQYGPWTESVQGVAVPTPLAIVCNYPSTSSHLNRYHRVRAVLQTSLGVSRVAYSPVWFMDA